MFSLVVRIWLWSLIGITWSYLFALLVGLAWLMRTDKQR